MDNLLKYQYPELHGYFQFFDNDDDFQIVGKRNRELTPEVLFRLWKNGSQCPPFLEDYVHLEPEIVDFWNQGIEERSILLQQWHEEILNGVKDDLKIKMAEYRDLDKEKQLVSTEKDLEILKMLG